MAGGVNGGGVPYDLLFGITRVEAPYVFSGIEERAGIDLQRRDRLLRTLVRNLFDYHQQVSEDFQSLYVYVFPSFCLYTTHVSSTCVYLKFTCVNVRVYDRMEKQLLLKSTKSPLKGLEQNQLARVSSK